MLKITTLIENEKGQDLDLINEHGLSILIEIDNNKILFDTGSSHAFIKNAEKLQLDLSKINYLILSHGHYDHTGGMKHLVNKYEVKYNLYAHEDIFIKKYREDNGLYKYLGMDFDKQWIIDNNININYVNEDIVNISKNAYIISNFVRISQYENNNEVYKVKSRNEYIIDDFHDEICLVLRTSKGLVVVLGCSHPGIENILETIISRFHETIYMVIGGTHLVRASKDRIKHTINFMKNKNINYIGVSHCTGKIAVLELEKVFGDKYFYNCTGNVISI
ncbi:MAG: MBL fold metallo-hydrolase [Vallitalea sp.]|jgi:7,8-dihydropterin-6-yl-methyl-4-(beta-D-ribofuranosyl)aminobenzene 5'-phosphate synthase|nr:MBL fold metallo-hydrolase [Vallitalea sp.]